MRGGVTLGLPPGRWLTSSGPRVEVTQGAPPGVGPGVCLVPLPLRTSDAGPCGHSASFPHGVVASRADGSPEEGPCCLLLVVGRGAVVRASWRRFRGWRREGSQVGRGRRSRTPHPGEERTSAGSCGCPWRRDPSLAPRARLSMGLGGERPEPGQAAGVSERWRCGEAGAGCPARSRLCPLHLVARRSGRLCASGTGCLGVCEAVAVALRVPWASGQKPLSLGVADVCWGHCTILRAAALIPPFPGGARPSATAGHSSSPSWPTSSPPSCPPSPHAQGGLSWEYHPQPALASRTVSSASAWPFTGSTWVRVTEQTEWSNES